MFETIQLKPLRTDSHMSEDAIVAEQELVLAAQQNEQAFSALYDRYFEGIFGFIYRRTDDEDLTADLVSQVFLKAIQNIKKYEFRGLPFSAWLYRIASNEVNRHYRKHKKQMIFSLEEGRVAELIDEEEENNEEKITLLMECLKELSTAVMEVLELRFFEAKSFKEIAFILEISESGAKMRTYRALEKLKGQFDIKIDDYNG
jgi:RNA polymerase sigma-70 factor (ECF subfamily)